MTCIAGSFSWLRHNDVITVAVKIRLFTDIGRFLDMLLLKFVNTHSKLMEILIKYVFRQCNHINDVIMTSYLVTVHAISVSVVIRISAYTILCKFGGHNISTFKVTWRGGGGCGPRRSKKAWSEWG